MKLDISSNYSVDDEIQKIIIVVVVVVSLFTVSTTPFPTNSVSVWMDIMRKKLNR